MSVKGSVAQVGAQIAVVGGLFLMSAPPAYAHDDTTPTAAASSSADPEPTSAGADQNDDLSELQRQKTEEEIRKLQIENDRADSNFGRVLAAAPFITVLVAILTLGFSVRSSRRENSRQRQADRDQRDAAMRQRSDEIFTGAITNLASAEAGPQAAGASSLLRLADGAAPAVQREILVYCTAQLRLGVAEKVRPIVREVFQRAVTVVFSESSRLSSPELNLQNADLTRVRLKELSLRGAHLDFTEANLTDADMYGSDLWGVRATDATLAGCDFRKANFGPAEMRGCNLQRARLSGARLGSAKLHSANVSGADFQGAKLQSAHFDGAIMNGVNFAQADVNDAYFLGATMDQFTIDSLSLARNLDKAHLPPMATPHHGDPGT